MNAAKRAWRAFLRLFVEAEVILLRFWYVDGTYRRERIERLRGGAAA